MELRIPVRDEYDVLVAGGGAAGCFAAICAARSGARTLLVERCGTLGGTMTVGGVCFPGLFHAWGKRVIDGPCWESVLRSGAKIPEAQYNPARHWEMQIAMNAFDYACVLDEMCREAGADALLHACVAAAREDGTGAEVAVAGREGLLGFRARALIDATGDGTLAGLLGCARAKSERLQPATLIHNLAGYELANVDRAAFERAMEAAYADGSLSPMDFQGQMPIRALENGRVSMHVDCPAAATSRERTALENASRVSLMRIVRAFRRAPGLENLRVRECATETGVRETYRVACEKTVTRSLYLSGEAGADAVCHAFYPIDVHEPTGIRQTFLAEGVVPAVPYGALVARDARRLLAAGRCIGSDTDANSALRVQATCMATGQAAGVAAAQIARTGAAARDADVARIRAGLTKLGAVIPEPFGGVSADSV